MVIKKAPTMLSDKAFAVKRKRLSVPLDDVLREMLIGFSQKHRLWQPYVLHMAACTILYNHALFFGTKEKGIAALQAIINEVVEALWNDDGVTVQYVRMEGPDRDNAEPPPERRRSRKRSVSPDQMPLLN